MHPDLVERIIGRRVRALADEPTEAPYDWAEFERRRREAAPAKRVGRNRLAATATAAAVAVAVIAGVAIVRSNHQHTPALARVNAATHAPAVAQVDRAARTRTSEQADAALGNNGLDEAASAAPVTATDRLAQARTRAIEGWLAGLPHDPVVVRVGTHVAVTSLQDQIAELDDLMSAERVAGAQPARLDSLEQQRAQLVSSLAQLRYAEMLASAAP